MISPWIYIRGKLTVQHFGDTQAAAGSHGLGQRFDDHVAVQAGAVGFALQ
jgi:hypothetical protein